MSTDSPETARPVFPLLRYFSGASFLALAATTVVITLLSRQMAIDQLVERWEYANSVLTRTIANSVTPGYANHLSAPRYRDGDTLRAMPETAELRRAIGDLIHDLAVVKVKIYSLDGITVFSTQASQIGEDKGDNAGFRIARDEGRAVSKLSWRDTFSAFSGEIFDRSIVETYVPVHLHLSPGQADVHSVFETYADVTPLLASINRAQRRLLIGVTATFVLLYGALFLIVQRADRVIDRQYERILVDEAALIQEKLQAQAAETAQGEFLANMSHEIRTPLTAILGYTEILAERGPLARTRAQRARAVETIRRNGEHLLEVINAILDISTVESGRVGLEYSPFSPTALAEEVVSLMRVPAGEKNLKLVLDIDSSVPAAVESDCTRVRQILLNLIGNGVKFTDAGAIRLALRYDDHPLEPKLIFDVTDTGVGMYRHEIEKVFQPFVQADSGPTRAGGSGLGLTISEKLTEVLGGTIDVASRIGEGSTFRIQIPVKSVPLDQLIYPDEPDREVRSGGGRADAAARRDLDCSVLLAEDSRDIQDLMRELLEHAGARVEVANNGAIAVEMVRTARAEGRDFDLILMDMRMPVLDGEAAVRQLREMEYDGPIVALTAQSMREDRMKCLEMGCDDYMSKPIDRDRLLELVERYASRTTPTHAPEPEAG